MEDYIARNRTAWEYNAYEFWIQEAGTPSERAARIRKDSRAELKKYSVYFPACN